LVNYSGYYGPPSANTSSRANTITQTISIYLGGSRLQLTGAANSPRTPVWRAVAWQRPRRALCGAQVYPAERYATVVKCLSAAVSAARVCGCPKSGPEDRSLLEKGQTPKHSGMKAFICNVYVFTDSKCFQQHTFWHCWIYV